MLFGKKKPTRIYKVFISKIAKYRSLVDSVSKGEFNSFIYFFENSRDEFDQLLKAAGIKEFSLVSAESIDENLTKPVALECHPMKSKNDQLIDQVGKESDLEFFIGLDESQLSPFGQDRLISLMEKMGIDPNEVIEHSMVSKSISRAHEKIEKAVRTETTVTSSAEEWMRLNYGDY